MNSAQEKGVGKEQEKETNSLLYDMIKTNSQSFHIVLLPSQGGGEFKLAFMGSKVYS